MSKTDKRIRDPIHGLIVFSSNNEIDSLAWKLIQTPEFQRLRRIKQLGVSELVYPGATHTRFSHSIGVYHNARKLMDVIRNEKGDDFDENRAKVVLLAALLHDIGHGPFSHAFENAREELAKNRNIIIEKHEKITARFITNTNGSINKILEDKLSEEVANVIKSDDPTDIYNAVVSSSFDADRLDYLMRDRYMTGTGAGSIDYDWLIDNLTTHEVIKPKDGPDDEPQHIQTFVFKDKGRQAAEDFLLARYRLYIQVYLHKTTRGFEQLLTAIIKLIGENCNSPTLIGLDAQDSLVKFLKEDVFNLELYQNLDDTVIWSAIERMRRSQNGEAKQLAEHFWNRQPLKALDIFAELGHNEEAFHNATKDLDNLSAQKLGKTIFKDTVSYDLYARFADSAGKVHKMVRIKAGYDAREITDFPDTVIRKELTEKRYLTRYYFLSDHEREDARKIIRGG